MGVTRVEVITTSDSGANTLTLTNKLVSSSDSGALTVSIGAGGATVDASSLQAGDTDLRGGLDVLRAQFAMQRAMARIKVARRRRTGAPSARP